MSQRSKKRRTAMLLAGMFALPSLTGCSVAVMVTRTMINEPLLLVDSIYLKAKMDRMAKKAWHEFKQENANLKFSYSFRDGFVTGFSSFLDAGGNCVPPAAPPRHYWKYGNLTASGYQKTKDFMEGYQEGSLRAKGSNLREMLLVPVLIGDDDLNPTSSSLKPNYPSPLNNRTPKNRVIPPPRIDLPMGDATGDPPLPPPDPDRNPVPNPGTIPNPNPGPNPGAGSAATLTPRFPPARSNAQVAASQGQDTPISSLPISSLPISSLNGGRK